MANHQSTENRIYVCHFCAKEFSNRTILLTHFSQCQINKSTSKLLNESVPQLNQFQQDCLHSVQLRPLKTSLSTNTISSNHELDLSIPLTHFYTNDSSYLPSQLSFDDSLCQVESNSFLLNDSIDPEYSIVHLPNYHIYKYSRREQKSFYLKLNKRYEAESSSSSNAKSPLISIQKSKTYLINIPTKIFSRQRLISNTTHSVYPLLLSPNFHTLVQYPINHLFQCYFHLLHSIASQEFDFILQKSSYENDYSSQSLSLMNILRKNMYDYQKPTAKRDCHDDDDDNDEENGYELSIPPLKIRRHNNSSYEIEKRSTSSSSSGMSITQITDDRRRFDTRIKPYSSRISDIQLNSNSNDTPDNHVGSPIKTELDSQQYKDRTSNKSNNDSLPKYQSVALNEGARIRIVNCSNDSNKHTSIVNGARIHPNSIDKLDENMTKTSRPNPRKLPLTDQVPSVHLSNDEIAKQWLTHNVFYRCHACSHEEFFVVFSRECMRLHVSSKHGNMEENFKQRLSNFLNSQNRPLKIFQHYLKWQQPWSENEIDQIFQLANIQSKLNGAV